MGVTASSGCMTWASRQKVDVVEELERDLAVRLEHGAVDVDLFVRLQRLIFSVFLIGMPSRMIWGETSIRPSDIVGAPRSANLFRPRAGARGRSR